MRRLERLTLTVKLVSASVFLFLERSRSRSASLKWRKRTPPPSAAASEWRAPSQFVNLLQIDRRSLARSPNWSSNSRGSSQAVRIAQSSAPSLKAGERERDFRARAPQDRFDKASATSAPARPTSSPALFDWPQRLLLTKASLQARRPQSVKSKSRVGVCELASKPLLAS